MERLAKINQADLDKLAEVIIEHANYDPTARITEKGIEIHTIAETIEVSTFME